MTHLLHIDASPRRGRSLTRRLTREFVRRWRDAHPGGTVTYRDVGHSPPPHVTEDWIAAAFTPPDRRTPAMAEALRASDAVVDEFLAADLIVAGVPMYNFGVPSGFKAYIDQIVRVGRTFLFEPDDPAAPYKPVARGKRMVLVTASGGGGYLPGGRAERLNHLHPYLRAAFGFIGVDDVEVVHVENDEFGGLRLEESVEAARRRIARLAGGQAETAASSSRRSNPATAVTASAAP
jgi:FMN-dependent NADH-azoreductase